MTNHRPKINFVLTSTGWGGLEINVFKLVRALQKDFEVLFTVRFETKVHSEVLNEGYQALVLAGTKKYMDFRNARKLASFNRQQGIQICFTAYRPDLDVLAWTKQRYQKELRVVYQQQMQLGLKRRGWVYRFRYGKIDRWIAPLNWLRNETLQKSPVREDCIRLVPLGVDLNLVRTDADTKSIRSRFGLPETAKVLGVLGRIDPKKAQLFVVQQLPKLQKLGDDWHILLFGSATIDDINSSEYERQIRQWIVDNKWQDYVHFAPFSPNVSDFYNAIDLFVMASESETYGMVTVEAMLHKVPVLGTQSGGTPELLGFGARGFLYPFNDSNGFLAGVERFKKSPFSRSQLQEIADFAAENYSLEKEAEGVSQILRELI